SLPRLDKNGNVTFWPVYRSRAGVVSTWARQAGMPPRRQEDQWKMFGARAHGRSKHLRNMIESSTEAALIAVSLADLRRSCHTRNVARSIHGLVYLMPAGSNKMSDGNAGIDSHVPD